MKLMNRVKTISVVLFIITPLCIMSVSMNAYSTGVKNVQELQILFSGNQIGEIDPCG